MDEEFEPDQWQDDEFGLIVTGSSDVKLNLDDIMTNNLAEQVEFSMSGFGHPYFSLDDFRVIEEVGISSAGVFYGKTPPMPEERIFKLNPDSLPKQAKPVSHKPRRFKQSQRKGKK